MSTFIFKKSVIFKPAMIMDPKYHLIKAITTKLALTFIYLLKQGLRRIQILLLGSAENAQKKEEDCVTNN